MLESIIGRHGISLDRVVAEAVDYFRRCLQPDGSIAEDPRSVLFREWDSVHVLKAVGLWRKEISVDTTDIVESVLGFLAAMEKPTGMLSWGGAEVAADKYSTETSSEYIMALTLLERVDQACIKADFLRSRQLANGSWEEVHNHVPKAFQLEPSVTGLAMMALDGLNMEPTHLYEALGFLAERQNEKGHFGISWYYYSCYYYLTRPAVAVSANFGNYPVVAAARDFVLAQQQTDGSWLGRADSAGTMAVSPEMHTALAVATLAYAGMTANDRAVRRAIDWLLDHRRPDGSWFGGYFPYPQTDSYRGFFTPQSAYTTAQVLAVFKQLELV